MADLTAYPLTTEMTLQGGCTPGIGIAYPIAYPLTTEMTLQGDCAQGVAVVSIAYPLTTEMTLQGDCAQGARFYSIMKLFTQPLIAIMEKDKSFVVTNEKE